MKSESESIIILITGAPGTGKTTLSKFLGAKLNWPVINKDEIKELLFDNLGVKDMEWQKQLGITSFNLVYYFIGKLLQTGSPFIIEGNFDNIYSTEHFNEIRKRIGFRLIQVYCHTDDRVRYERYQARDASGERHPGHIRLNWAVRLEDFIKHTREREFIPLDILQEGDQLVDIDTTSFEEVNYEQIYEDIKRIAGI